MVFGSCVFALEIVNPYVFAILGDYKFLFLGFGNLVKIQSELGSCGVFFFFSFSFSCFFVF